MSETAVRGDYFERARAWAGTGLMLAGGLAIIGSMLDWITITARPGLLPGADFGTEEVEAPEVTEPFTGLEAGDGWIVLLAGIVLFAMAVLLVTRRRGLYAWLAFLASVAIGSVAIADYRGVGDLGSSISRRMDIVGEAEPAIGLILVAISAGLGLISSVAGIAASPRPE